MTLTQKDIEINKLACALAKKTPKELNKELRKLSLDKLFRIAEILHDHYDILVEEFGVIDNDKR